MTPDRHATDIGLLGGTFDPPHRGHLGMGKLARDRLELERVLYMPAPSPPHKAHTTAAFEDRRRMTELLVAGEPGLEVSDFEQGLPAPHYTVRTLERLSAGPLAGARIWLLIGADSLRELHLWKEFPRLFELARVVAISRVGYALGGNGLAPELLAQVVRLDELAEPVSSTELRRRLAAGEPTPEVPAAVTAYIRERGLYQ